MKRTKLDQEVELEAPFRLLHRKLQEMDHILKRWVVKDLMEEEVVQEVD